MNMRHVVEQIKSRWNEFMYGRCITCHRILPSDDKTYKVFPPDFVSNPASGGLGFCDEKCLKAYADKL